MKWISKGNGCHEASLGCGFYIRISWGKTGFIVDFEHQRHVKIFQNLEDAKDAGVKLAKNVLAKVLKNLES